MDQPATPPRRHVPGAPQQRTTFVGRRQELSDVAASLRSPECRLLTLVGPGGIGKTRLALEAVSRVTDHFDDGVYFVPLQSVQSPEFLISAIADVLDVSLAGQTEPTVPLLNYLRDKELLLLLDNFEQLVPEGGVEILADVLQTAPRVHLLVTSREVLNLQEEWLYAVQGLSLSDSRRNGDADAGDAVQLFVERARRVRRDFSLEDEQAHVVEICELVEGMPLALELAASWIKSLSAADVVAEIRRNIDFLTTSLRNVPDRHRSMRAIFAQSWTLLSPEEQVVFKRLSVFRGDFQRDAAEYVAGASLPILSSLVDKSLVRWDPAGRYHVHELLRQYGAEQLQSSPELGTETRNLHAEYYTHFLGDRFEDLTEERQREALAEIVAELDNVWPAWHWAIDGCRIADLEYAAMGLHTYCQYRGRFREGLEAFAAAVAAVEEAPPSMERDRTLALLLTCAGWLEMRFGHVQEAARMQERALSLYDRHELEPIPGQGTDPLTALSLLAVTRGDYEQALALGTRAWERAEAREDKKNMAFAGHGLAGAALAQGDYETALEYAQEALALTQSVGNRWFMAYVYNQLGQINRALGKIGVAGDFYRASYIVKEELGDPEGMALALHHLGEIALEEESFRQAHDLYRQSVALYRKLGDRGGLIRTLQGLGVASHQMGHTADARRHFAEALRIASEARVVPLTLSLLVDIGRWLLDGHTRERGIATLTLVARHPAGDQITRDRAQGILDEHGVDLSAEPAIGVESELDMLITILLAEFSADEETDEASDALTMTAPAEQPLIDPLSERELEVLHHVAAGLKNREIAARLTVTLSTVKSHINNIYRKLDVNNRVQAISRARELDLLEE